MDVITVLVEAEYVIREIQACITEDVDKAVEDAEIMLRVIVSVEDL